MKYHYLLSVLLFFFLVLACKNTIKESLVININADEPKSHIDLKLSDLADSFKLIPLETTKECLLDNRTDFYISRNYILAYSESGVYKFSSEGKFLKKLFGLGRGPNEFVNLLLCIFTVEEDNDLLYINDQIQKGIYLRYDLKSEHFLEPIKQCFSAFGSFDIYGDSLMIVSNLLKSNYAVYYQDFNGEFKSGITQIKKYMSYKNEMPQKGRLIKAGSNYYYSFLYDDTLFKINEYKLIPYLALNFKTPRENPPRETLTNGDRFVNFQSGNPSFFIIHVNIIEDVNLYNRGIGGEKGYYLILNNLSGKASRIDSYTDNFVGETKDASALGHVDFFNPFFLKLQYNNKIITPYYPSQIKKAIEKGLNYKDFPVGINKQLLKLNKTLQETDNPVLMIGTIKDKI